MFNFHEWSSELQGALRLNVGDTVHILEQNNGKVYCMDWLRKILFWEGGIVIVTYISDLVATQN